jgi:hypothetical protein
VKEVIGARVWSGIHFRTADVQGSVIGKKVAHWLRKHYFTMRLNRVVGVSELRSPLPCPEDQQGVGRRQCYQFDLGLNDYTSHTFDVKFTK